MRMIKADMMIISRLFIDSLLTQEHCHPHFDAFNLIHPYCSHLETLDELVFLFLCDVFFDKREASSSYVCLKICCVNHEIVYLDRKGNVSCITKCLRKSFVCCRSEEGIRMRGTDIIIMQQQVHYYVR